MQINVVVPQAVFESKSALMAAKEGHRLACKDLEAMNVNDLDIGNPNHPINDGIFGYERKAFLTKQYE